MTKVALARAERPSKTALAFGLNPDQHLLLTVDPEAHKWKAVERCDGRFPRLRHAFGKVIYDASAEDPRSEARTAVSRLIDFAARRMANEAHYRRGLVRSVLFAPEYCFEYRRFIAAARKIDKRDRPSPRGTSDFATVPALPKLAAHDAQVERLIVQLQQVDKTGQLQRPRFTVCTPPEERLEDVFWFVRDPLFPAEIAEAMLGRLKSEAAYVLIRAKQDVWSDDDLLALSMERMEGVEQYGAFLAGIPGASIAGIPAEKKLDVLGIIARHQAGREALKLQTPRIIAELEK